VAPAEGAKFITTTLGRVHYIDGGEGPPILLMHGSGRSIADWQEGTIERLALHHRVIAFDYFGNGFSERTASYTYGYDLWVNEAVALLSALKIEHVTVIGHSVGGALACILAADHPELADHVVTIGTGMTIEPQQFMRSFRVSVRSSWRIQRSLGRPTRTNTARRSKRRIKSRVREPPS